MPDDPKERCSPQQSLASAVALVAEGAEDAMADLKRLVAVDTSFPPGVGYPAFAELIAELTHSLGFTAQKVVVPEGLWRIPGDFARGERTNLVCRRRTGKSVISLYFHVDTVPRAPGWSGDPFTLRRAGSCLFGLGAADMKGTIAAVLLALRTAQKCQLPLAYDPDLLLCTDEEGGLYPGVRYLAEQGLVAGHALNLNGVAAPRIWAGCFGTINLLIQVKGEAVHSAEGNRAGYGVNAIEGALPILNALSALKSQVVRRTSALPPPPHVNGPLTAQLSIAAVHGGCAGGQVPALCEILVSRRYAPEETFEEACAEMEAAIRKAVAGTPLAVEFHLVGHLSPVDDPGGPHWPRWQKALCAGFGYAPADFRRWGATSSSDFGFVQNAGIREGLLGGLGRPECNIHGPDEHTTLEDIVALAKSVLAYLAADFEADLIPESDKLCKGKFS